MPLHALVMRCAAAPGQGRKECFASNTCIRVRVLQKEQYFVQELNKSRVNMFQNSYICYRNPICKPKKKGNAMNYIASTFAAAMALLVLFTFAPQNAGAQYQDPRAAEILEAAREHYESSIKNIDDYVVEYEHHTVSYIKRYDNGRPYMAVYSDREYQDDLEAASGADETDLFSPETFSMMKERARYMGTERIDGHEVHVIFIDELEGFIEDDEDMDDEVKELRIFLDTGNFVMRKMAFKVEAYVDGEVRVIEPEIHFRDYQEVEGLPIAFEQVTIVSGLSDMISDEERQEMQEAFAEMERELEQMPEQQRQMVERMMAGQMEELKEMLEADQFEHTMRVKDVQVNVGLE